MWNVGRGNGPVLDNTLKNEDFPTFGNPVMGVRLEKTRKGLPRTNDSNLEVIGWASEEYFLLRSCRLFGGHFLLELGGGWVEVPGEGGRPSLISFQKIPAHGHVLEDHGSREGKSSTSSGNQNDEIDHCVEMISRFTTSARVLQGPALTLARSPVHGQLILCLMY